MFHLRDGVYFERDDNGDVSIHVRTHAGPDALVLKLLAVTQEEWASVVASVSASGETGETWRAALDFHGGASAAPPAPRTSNEFLAEIERAIEISEQQLVDLKRLHACYTAAQSLLEHAEDNHRLILQAAERERQCHGA